MMRCAIFIAIACVALSAASFEEPKVDEELFLANNKVSEEYEESFIEAGGKPHPAQKPAKKTNVLTEEDLMMKGPYWKWTSKFRTKDDGKYRMRELMTDGKVQKRSWALIGTAKKKKTKTKKSKIKDSPSEEIMVQAQGQAGWWRRRRRHRHRRHRHRRHRHRRFLSRLPSENDPSRALSPLDHWAPEPRVPP